MNEFEILQLIPKNRFFSTKSLFKRFSGEPGLDRKLLNLQRFGFLEAKIRRGKTLRRRFFKYSYKVPESCYEVYTKVKYYRRLK